MLHKILKKKPPGLLQILDNLNRPSAAELASALGVSVRTASRWIAAESAPRPVLLALYWCTTWGLAEINCEAINDALMQAQLCMSWRSRAERAEAQVSLLLRLHDYGSANSPLMAVKQSR